eukprot:scaffold2038_cov259-Pinguiococcus_pyrenoidosus.AAC.3
MRLQRLRAPDAALHRTGRSTDAAQASTVQSVRLGLGRRQPPAHPVVCCTGQDPPSSLSARARPRGPPGVRPFRRRWPRSACDAT